MNVSSSSGFPTSEPMAFGSSSNAPTSSSSGSKARKDNITCSHCGYTVHSKDQCYRLLGYPPGWKSKSKSSNVGSMANNSEFVETLNAGPPDTAISSLTSDQCQ